jgi:hypothetical protein
MTRSEEEFAIETGGEKELATMGSDRSRRIHSCGRCLYALTEVRRNAIELYRVP